MVDCFTQWAHRTQNVAGLYFWQAGLLHLPRAGLTIRGPHTNARRGLFSHTRSQDFLWRCTF